MSEPESPFPRVWGPRPVIAALWLATPLLALLGYGWGWGIACLLGAIVAYEGYKVRPGRFGAIKLMLVGLHALWFVDPRLSTDHPDIVARWYGFVGVAAGHSVPER